MTDRTLIYVVDDDDAVRDSLEAVLLGEGYDVEGFASAETFLADGDPSIAGCCLMDVRMPGKDGLTLLSELDDGGATLPIIIMKGHGDVPMAVKAMKLGAIDFIEKPFRHQCHARHDQVGGAVGPHASSAIDDRPCCCRESSAVDAARARRA